MSATVLVYNLGGDEFLHRVSLQHAIKRITHGIYRIIQSVPGKKFGEHEYPTAVELVHYRYAKWKYNRTGVVSFSKKAVLRRDGYSCAYCGNKATTIDHVKPKSKGFAATWENSVAACQPCNNKKGDKFLEQTNMRLNFEPYTPTFEQAYRWTHPEKDWL